MCHERAERVGVGCCELSDVEASGAEKYGMRCVVAIVGSGHLVGRFKVRVKLELCIPTLENHGAFEQKV